MKKLKHNLKRLKIEDGHDVKVELSDIYFIFRTDEVVSANEVPIGLLKEFYDLFLKGFSECCAAKIFGTSKCCKNQFNFQWYRFLRFRYLGSYVLVYFIFTKMRYGKQDIKQQKPETCVCQLITILPITEHQYMFFSLFLMRVCALVILF